MTINKPELIMPGGSFSKIITALDYGADAIYCGCQGFNLRAGADNLSFENLDEILDYAHKYDKRIYLTLNAFPHETKLEELKDFLKEVKNHDIDAVIVSDPGVLMLVKEILGDIEVHISTQANTVNSLAANFWKSQGADRVILARELSLEDIQEFHKNSEIEIEAFIHGAMCVSYSGRCLLSAFLTGREANLGDCAQSCRWQYFLKEEMRPDEPPMTMIEDNTGTYVLSSRDMCLIEHIDKLAKAGITSFKIEGRMKSEYYAATVARVYRDAIDRYAEDPENFTPNPLWLEELKKVSHRPYCTGFYFGQPEMDRSDHNQGYIRDYKFLGIVKKTDSEGVATIDVRNQIKPGFEVEFYGPKFDDAIFYNVTEIFSIKGKVVDVANPGKFNMKVPDKVQPGWFIRMPATKE